MSCDLINLSDLRDKLSRPKPHPVDANDPELWSRLRNPDGSIDIVVRNTIVERCMGLIRMHAGNFRSRHTEFDERIQIAAIAVMNAVPKYDPTRRCSFTTYIQRRIVGALLDHDRDSDELTRTMRKEVKAGKRHNMKIRPLATPLFFDEGCNKMMTIADLLVDERSEQDIIDIDGWLDQQCSLLWDHSRVTRTILRLRFVDDLTLKEIGKAVGLSESRISQMLTQMMTVLKQKHLQKERAHV